jgi:hypothetical protein
MRLSQSLIVAVVLLMGLTVQRASADPISFSVLGGIFHSSRSDQTSYNNGSTEANVSFAHATSLFNFDLDDGETRNISSFGLFSVWGEGRRTVSIDDRFTLFIRVFQPASGIGWRTAELEGSLRRNAAGEDLVISFPPGSLNIPQNTLPNLSFNFGSVTLSEVNGQSRGHLGGSTTYHALSAAPPPVSAAAPLPATVWMGIALLGGVGLKRLRGRKVATPA